MLFSDYSAIKSALLKFAFIMNSSSNSEAKVN